MITIPEFFKRKRSFPIHHQLDSMDCGAACIQMIAHFYGKEYNIEYIQEICRKGIEGISLKSICDGLETLGFHTVAGKVTYEDLCNKAFIPCILHWKQNHFVVLYKIKSIFGKETFYIADPGVGKIEVCKKDMIDNWVSTNTNGYDKGVVVLMEPSTLFENIVNTASQTKQRTNIKFLWKYFNKYLFLFGQILLGLLVTGLFLLISPFLTQSIIDVGISSNSILFVKLVLLGQLFLVCGNVFLAYLRNKLLLHVGTRINIALISDFFIKLMRLPLSFFDTKMMGDLLQRIEDHHRLQTFLTTKVLALVYSIFSFFVFGAVLCIYDVRILFIFLISSFVYGIWLKTFITKRKSLDYKRFEVQAKNQSKTYQLINSIQETKLHNAERRKRWEWEDVQTELFEVSMNMLILQQNQNIGSAFITQIRNVLITILVATNVINGETTLGIMLAIQFLIGELNAPVEQMISFIYDWQDVSISLERISEIHYKKDENDNRPIYTIDENDKNIYIKNLSFNYPGGNYNNALKNINLVIPEGKITAIVGTSGSGKSTLLKLLLGYYEPSEGIIQIGPSALNRINLSWWHDQCGVVMQNGYIYSDTIAGNIAIADNEPNLKKLEYAAKVSNSYEFIDQLPLKYNTLIGDDGQGLSQGQKQRILIARAVYKDPHFIFLDEATNSLDANNEKSIVENLSEFYKGRTVVLVAHRLSTVKSADQIVVIDKGQVVEVGSHEDLIKKQSKYYELIKNQLDIGE